MASEWQQLTLREAGVELIDCEHRTPPAAEDGYPYVAIPQLRGGRIDLSDVRRITPEHFTEWSRKARPAENDVVLSRRTNPGETAFVPRNLEFALGQNLVLLRSDGKQVYPPFLRWLVRGPEWWEQIKKFLNVGAVFDSLKCADVPEFMLTIPPLPDQRAIARVLGALDDKIELNRRMSETHEAVARALFESWFVDFDPVSAKAEGRDPGLPKALANLFPDRFTTSALGEIPQGWTTKALDQIADYVNGAACQKYLSEGEAETVPVIKIRELNQGVSAQSDRVHLNFPSKHRADDGDVLFSWSGTLICRVWAGGPGFVNQHVFKVSSEKYPRWFYLYWTNRHLDAFRDIAAGKATTMGHIKREHLRTAMVFVPPDDLVAATTQVIEPLIDRRVNADLESRSLQGLRDTLLPKLVSGELRLADAERLVESAV